MVVFLCVIILIYDLKCLYCVAVTTEKLIVIPGEDMCIKPSSKHLSVIWQTSEDGSCYCSLWYRMSQCSCSMSGNFNVAYNKENSVGATELCFKNATNNTVISMVCEFLSSTSLTTTLPLITQEIFEFYVLLIAGKSITRIW